MRLQAYLVEGTKYNKLSLSEAIDEIHLGCRPFLKEFGKVRLFRGLMTPKLIPDVDQALHVVPRTDRRPRDMDPKFFNAFNKIFKEMFGWPARKGVFATKMGFWTMRDCVFFPVGRYKYVYAPEVVDLYTWQTTFKNRFGRGELSDEAMSELRKWIKEKNYKSTGLVSASKNTEAMFNCISYYLINGYNREVIEELI